MKNRLTRWLAVVSTTIFVGMVMAQELGPGARPVGADWSRSPVMSINGMAATAQPLASNIAIDVLQAGGSAVDAAVAANAALGLMEPTANGIGGDLFAIVWDPKTKQLYGYNASGRAPMSRSLDELREAIAAMKAQGKIPENYVGIPSHGSLSVTVPGAVDGWFALHERWGRLPMSDVLAAPIDYARNGFPLSPVIAAGFEGNRKEFQSVAAMIEEQDNATKTYFPGNVAPKAGDIFKNPDLARTFSALANEGRSAFYEGSIAQAMADYFEDIGADLTLDDLKAHTGEWVEPRGVEYHGYTLYELPPNGQGFAALMMLNILKQVELNEFDRGSVDIFHYMVEAKRLAYESMAGTFADPDFAEIPIDKLLSENHAKRQFARIRPDTVIEPNYLAIPLEGEGDTTYLTVVDGDGMMVSLIQSNYRGMGSGLVPTGLGFMLQDRGELFSLEDGHPNIYAPGKRPFHTIIPAMVTHADDGQLLASLSNMGGFMQPQGHLQLLLHVRPFVRSFVRSFNNNNNNNNKSLQFVHYDHFSSD